MRAALIALASIACKRELPPERPAPPGIEVTITTELPGAAPSTVATSVTGPLEHELGQLAGLQRMTSRSARDTSTIALAFAADASRDGINDAVQTAVAKAQRTLPDALRDPPTHSQPVTPLAVVRFTLASNTLPMTDVADHARRIAASLLQVPQVGDAVVCGAHRPRYEIHIDAEAFDKRAATILDLEAELLAKGANIDQPATLPLISSVAKIARVEGIPHCRAFSRGTEVTSVSLLPLAGSDLVALRRSLGPVIAELRRTLPPAIDLEVIEPAPVTELVALPTAPDVLAVVKKLDSPLVELADSVHAIGDVATPLSLTKLGPAVHTIALRGRDRSALTAAFAALFAAPSLRVVGTIGDATQRVTDYVVDDARRSQLGVALDPKLLRALSPTGERAPSQFTQLDQIPVRIMIDPTDPPAHLLEVLHAGGVPLSAIMTMKSSTEPVAILRDGEVPWLGLYVAGTRAELDGVLAKLPVPTGIERTLQ